MGFLAFTFVRIWYDRIDRYIRPNFPSRSVDE